MKSVYCSRKLILDCKAPIKCRVILMGYNKAQYIYITLSGGLCFHYAFSSMNPRFSYRPDIIGD